MSGMKLQAAIFHRGLLKAARAVRRWEKAMGKRERRVTAAHTDCVSGASACQGHLAGHDGQGRCRMVIPHKGVTERYRVYATHACWRLDLLVAADLLTTNQRGKGVYDMRNTVPRNVLRHRAGSQTLPGATLVLQRGRNHA